MTLNTDLYRHGYRALQGSWLHAIAVVVLVTILQSIAGSVFVGVVVMGALTIGQYIYFLGVSRTQSHPQIEVLFDAFRSGDRFIQSIIALLLVGILTVVGFFCFVIPGIIAGVGLSMTFFVMADDPKIRATDAMRKSWNMVWEQGNFWKVLGFHFLAIPLFVLGALLLVIGMLFVIPVYFTALAGLYDTLRGADASGLPEGEFF